MRTVVIRFGSLGFPEKADQLGDELIELCESRFGAGDQETYKSKNNVAFALALDINASQALYTKALEFAEAACKFDPENAHYWNSLGLARYRNSDWEGAMEAINQSIERSDGGDPTDRFILAMSLQQSGEDEAAQQMLSEATTRLSERQLQNMEVKKLKSEAGALILGNRTCP